MIEITQTLLVPTGDFCMNDDEEHCEYFECKGNLGWCNAFNTNTSKRNSSGVYKKSKICLEKSNHV